MVLLLMIFARASFAQESPSADSGAAGNVAPVGPTPPQMREFAHAEYPYQAFVEGTTGTVVLKLTIAIDGSVSDAEVVTAAGQGFDEAAQIAAKQCRFSPALRDGVPVAARILLQYDFVPTPTPEPVPSSEPAPPVAPPPPVAPATPTAESAPSPTAPVEVTVQGKSESDRLRESSQAVKVIDTEKAKRRSADLGEVLARTEGVAVRRGGGLGSDERLSLGGLTDEQIRFTVDDLPLEFNGYGTNLSSIPVNFVERIEIYHGVVPIRFGADALGGLINVVTDREVQGTHASISQSIGSFGTYRSTLGATHLDEPTGLYARANLFVDTAENDYPIDVEVADDSGQLHPATVNRFHDGYKAKGVGVELGIVRQPWARRLAVRAHTSNSDTDIQHNIVMTVPYGDVVWGESQRGGTIRYDQRLGRGVFLDAVAGYAYSTVYYRDVGTCVYDWYGDCVRVRRIAGEVDADAKDQYLRDHALLARPTLKVVVASGHTLSGSISGEFVKRSGEDLRTPQGTRDPLNAKRDLLTVVSGLEYELDAFEERLENTVFVKHYLQAADTEEVMAGNVLRERDRDTSDPGIGDSVRFRFADWLYAKASYEWATRLPRPDEVFGDGARVLANLEIEPERSHNVNLGVVTDVRETPLGDFRLVGNGFLRDAKQLIVLLGNDRVFSYQNVYGARSLGWEAAGGWTAPRGYLSLDGNVTWQSFRNTSSNGTFGDFEGDRIPNRPWLFANFAAVGKLTGLISPRDELSLGWDVRYVKEYFRGWESVGLRQFKQTVPSQVLHNLALTYLVKARALTTTSTIEVQNLTDEMAFDFFGVQKPGRAFFWKGTLEL